jgi:hypothetical protein
MKRVKIINKNRYDYTLEDDDKKEYVLNIEFYQAELNVGDYIYISDKVLKEKNLFAFGPLMEDKNRTEDDIIKVVQSDKEFYLQRYYG